MSTFDIEATFAIEATVPGGAAYSSVKARASLGLVTQLEAASEDEARDGALELLAKVTEDVKLHLAANAPGVDFYTDEYGVGQIGIGGVVEVDPTTSATAGKDAATAAPTKPAATAPASSAGSNDSFTPISHGGDRYTVLWNGKQRTVFDNRESKTGNQPDLKMPEGRNGEEEEAFWIATKSGGQNKAALAIIHQINESVPA